MFPLITLIYYIKNGDCVLFSPGSLYHAEISDDEGWAPLSHIGNILLKRYPDFDVRNYGFLKLTKLMKSCNCFEINATRKELAAILSLSKSKRWLRNKAGK